MGQLQMPALPGKALVRPAARAMRNRTSDMLDRRRDARHGGLAQNDSLNGGRYNGRDEDEDGML